MKQSKEINHRNFIKLANRVEVLFINKFKMSTTND